METKEETITAPALVIGNAVESEDGYSGLILSFTESGDFAKVRYYEDGELKFRSFDVKKLKYLPILPLRDDTNRFIVHPYHPDFLSIIGAQFGLKREYFTGKYFKIPAHMRGHINGKCLRISYRSIDRILSGQRAERIANDKGEISSIKFL